MTQTSCDLVLEGGGVKGIGLVGAIQELAQAGYAFQRIGGTSAGAVVGSLIAAGISTEDAVTVMQKLDYRNFRDKDLLDKLGWPGEGLSLLLAKGIYEGKYLHTWLSEQLAFLGVQTFADLKLTEPWAAKLPPEQRYKLVVITADVSRGRLVRLPWDYKLYGLHPDTQLVADAVRASMSIPFFYEPAKLGDSYLVDGVIVSNFPIAIFDDTNPWPTFGIKLSAKENAYTSINPVHTPIDFAEAIVSTMMGAHDQMHLDEPGTIERTMFVDTGGIKATNFEITKAQQQQLLQSGRHAAQKFLKTWNFASYQRKYGTHKHVKS